MFKLLIKLLTMKLLINILLIMGAGGLMYKLVMLIRGGSFPITDLVVPPLEQVSCEEYAYGCKINGYRCEPSMVYKCEMQGGNKKYIKYKIIDSDNLVNYTGLYNNLGIKVGDYIIFSNGQEYIITSLDMVSEPEDCPMVRKSSLKK